MRIINRIYERRIKPLLNSKYTHKTSERNVINVITNNTCNLTCYSCSALCDKAIGTNLFREEAHKLNPFHLEIFLENIENYKPDYWIRLQGGETTCIEPETIEKYVEIIHRYDRKVDILTNGFRIMDLDPHIFDAILLDEHKQNKETIQFAIKMFENKNYENYQIHILNEHIDLETMRKNNKSPGINCKLWFNEPSLYDQIVYPCCRYMFLEGWSNISMRQWLENCGYHIHNQHLTQLLLHPLNGISPPIIEFCEKQCWEGGKNIIKKPTNYKEEK